MKLLTITDVMKLLDVGKPTATRILQMKECPTLPRKKGCTYLVPEAAFIKFMETFKL